VRILSYFHGIDPAAALIEDGRVVAYIEEERLLRNKHAANLFPIRSIEACLKLGGAGLGDIDAIVYGWDAPRYGSGAMAKFYDEVNVRFPPDDATRRWQQRNVGLFAPAALRRTLVSNLVRHFGVTPDKIPELHFVPHHESHAAAAFYLSPFDEALVLTLDGSGDSDCTTVWRGRGATLEALHRIELPHSLGWFYAAITEYLGFDAYDGEYKVMGLAAYGRENLELRAKLAQIVKPGALGFDYEVDPSYLHHGAHTYSDRFTDQLPVLFGMPPRQGPRKLEPIHEDLAFEAQRLHEETVIRGLGASAGQREGIARRVAGASDFDRIQRGDVLLTEATTEAFNILLPLLSAIVTDSGGALSHAAIVSREYGIPGVVGTRDATERIADGALVRVDGDAGTVTVLG